MNKIVLGSLLVTMMGGVPGATYLLTRDSDTPEKGGTTTEKKNEDCATKESGAECPPKAK